MTDFINARLKLTLIYIVIITTLIAVSFYISINRSQYEVEQIRNIAFINNRPILQLLISNRIDTMQNSFIKEVTKLNLLLIIPSTFIAYLLSGLTLRPIERNFKKKEEFASEASHELRTPLTNMKLELENYKKTNGKIDHKTQQLIISISEELDRMHNTIDSLMSLISTESNIKAVKFNLKKVINSLIKQFNKKAETKSINIILNTDTECIVCGVKEQVRTLLSILIDNAIKYSHNNTNIKINISEIRNHLNLEIINEGVGIKTNNINKIFNKFYRENNELTRKSSGSGLGLSLAKKLAEQNNIPISVVSKKNFTTFLLKFRT